MIGDWRFGLPRHDEAVRRRAAASSSARSADVDEKELARREETIAISDIANTPFAMPKSSMNDTSKRWPDLVVPR